MGRGKGGSKTRRRLAREGGPRGERGFTAAAAAALLPFPEAEAEEALRAPASLFNSPLPSLPLPTSFGFRIKGGTERTACSTPRFLAHWKYGRKNVGRGRAAWKESFST